MTLEAPRAVMAADLPLRALVIDEWPPFPPDSGRSIRTWNLLKRLAARHAVSFLCYGDPATEACRRVREAGIRLHTVRPFAELRGLSLYCDLLANMFSRFPYSVWKHYTPRFEETLKMILNEQEFDLVHCECTPYGRFLDGVHRPPALIMAHNIESQILFRRAQNGHTMAERVFFSLQARKMEAFERRVLARASCVAAVTELDAECLRSWGVKQIALVENGVDLEYFSPMDKSPSQNEILFLASLDWYPNEDALDYLVREIFPLVLKQRPETLLRVVGRRPSPEIRRRIGGRPKIELVGEVPDARPFLARAGAVVVPLRIGGGSRIKILEALAMGKAVVSTSVGAEGLVTCDGEHLFIADFPEDFARRTVELLDSPSEQRRLGENGRKLVEIRYNWDRIAEALERAWMQTTEVGHSPKAFDSPLGVGLKAGP
jgi:glycosyltransferase involved in cell wall biosynthesis